jgi:hypothetical protein
MTYPPQPGWQPPNPNPNVPPPPMGYGAPYGQPYGPPLPPPYVYGRPKRLNRWGWVLLSVLAVATVVLIIVHFAGPGDDAQIKVTISQFADAVDHNDTSRARSYLCAEEAQQVADGDGAGSTNDDTVEPTLRLPVEVTDIHISGDSATAKLSRPSQRSRTLQLKKETGTWKLCNPGPE